MNIRFTKPLRFLLVAATLLMAASVWADKVYLKNGDVISGKITAEGADSIRIEVRSGSIKDLSLIHI